MTLKKKILIRKVKNFLNRSCTNEIIMKQLTKYPNTKHYVVSAKTGQGII